MMCERVKQREREGGEKKTVQGQRTRINCTFVIPSEECSVKSVPYCTHRTKPTEREKIVRVSVGWEKNERKLDYVCTFCDGNLHIITLICLLTLSFPEGCLG